MPFSGSFAFEGGFGFVLELPRKLFGFEPGFKVFLHLRCDGLQEPFVAGLEPGDGLVDGLDFFGETVAWGVLHGSVVVDRVQAGAALVAERCGLDPEEGGGVVHEFEGFKEAAEHVVVMLWWGGRLVDLVKRSEGFMGVACADVLLMLTFVLTRGQRS